MSKYTYCSKIFEPDYAYRCAIRQTGEHSELKSMLDAIGGDQMIAYTDDFEKVYPLRTFYHRFKRNILVLTNTGEGFTGQTFRDGRVGESFQMESENNEVENFFREAGEELTVLDFFTGQELKPDYQTVASYMAQVQEAERELDQHRERMESFKERLLALREECGAFYSTTPATGYKKAIFLLEECMETAQGAFRIHYRTLHRDLERAFAYTSKEENLLKLFGLYVFVLKFGLENKRFLKHNTRARSLNFNRTINDMRKLISENEGIVERYMDYMELSKNDRENLTFLLKEEEMIGYGSRADADLFC